MANEEAREAVWREVGSRNWASYLEDMAALENAAKPAAVHSISRAMQGLGRWTEEAERQAHDTLRRLGEACDHGSFYTATNGSHVCLTCGLVFERSADAR